MIFLQTNFFNETHDFQRFIVENKYLLGNYTILSEQLSIKNNKSGILDILALDNQNKRITIIELKNTKIDDKSIWQPLRYYDLIKRGEHAIVEILKENNCYNDNIDLNPKIILVVPKCEQQLIRTISYFTDIDICIIEIKKEIIENKVEINKQVFYPSSVFHKENLSEIKEKKYTNWSIDNYKKCGISSEKIKNIECTIQKIKNHIISDNSLFDIFYKESQISITKNGKVIVNIEVKKNPISHYYLIQIKTNGVFDKFDFLYLDGIEKVTFKDNKIKLKINKPIDNFIVKKYI
jgi:hypothetical protein